MDSWTIFFIAAVAVAIGITIAVMRRGNRDEADRKVKIEEPPAAPVEPDTEQPEANAGQEVVVLYESGVRSAYCCRSCGCEYSRTDKVCAVCGERL